MSLTSAWIHRYLLSVAEEHGQDLKLSLQTRIRKVQLTEFLSSNVGQDTVTWAAIRDAEALIPIKFTREAVANFESSGKSFATLLYSLIRIKTFEVIATRLPDPHKQRATPDLHLALQCNYVEHVGSLDPPKKGFPWIEQDELILTWITGLRRQGGGGNVLKNRKEEMAKRSITVPSPNSVTETTPSLIHSTPVAVPHRRRPPEMKALKSPVAAPYRRRPLEVKALGYYKEQQLEESKNTKNTKNTKALPRRTRRGSHPLELSSQPSPSSSISEPISEWEETPPRERTIAQIESLASPTPGQRRRSQYPSPSILSSQPAQPHTSRVPLRGEGVPASQSIPEIQSPTTLSSLSPKSRRFFVDLKSPSRPMDGYLSCCAVNAILKGRTV